MNVPATATAGGSTRPTSGLGDPRHRSGLVLDRPADFVYQTALPSGDALIAATAQVHSLVLVTRNESDFDPMGVPLVNPWREQP